MNNILPRVTNVRSSTTVTAQEKSSAEAAPAKSEGTASQQKATQLLENSTRLQQVPRWLRPAAHVGLLVEVSRGGKTSAFLTSAATLATMAGVGAAFGAGLAAFLGVPLGPVAAASAEGAITVFVTNAACDQISRKFTQLTRPQ